MQVSLTPHRDPVPTCCDDHTCVDGRSSSTQRKLSRLQCLTRWPLLGDRTDEPFQLG